MLNKTTIKIFVFCFVFCGAAFLALNSALAEYSALSVSLSASPSSGCVPLSGVSLSAVVSGAIKDNITYFFDCTGDGTWEKTISSNSNYVNASGICNFGSPGDYTAKVRLQEQNGAFAENSTKINVYACYPSSYQSGQSSSYSGYFSSYYSPSYYPSSYYSSPYSSYSPGVDIKANGFDGAVTIPYNTSAVLTWSSINADYCNVSGDWSGQKANSGSESTGNLTSSKTYTIICNSSQGSSIDSVTVNVLPLNPSVTVKKTVSNVSKGTGFSDSVTAEPGDVVSFSIQVTTGNSYLSGVTLKDTSSGKTVYRSNSLKINGIAWSGNVFSGLDLGNLLPNQTKTVTYEANIPSAENFSLGDNSLSNSVTVSNSAFSVSDSATIVVVRKAATLPVQTVKPVAVQNQTAKPVVAGTTTTSTAPAGNGETGGTTAGATAVGTGLTNNILFDSFLIPLAIAFFLVWIFRSNIIKLEQWLDQRKSEYRKYKSDKTLRLKVRKIRTEEFLNKK
jgi:uncharacterized repeat protein (TIGR01451 family)